MTDGNKPDNTEVQPGTETQESTSAHRDTPQGQPHKVEGVEEVIALSERLIQQGNEEVGSIGKQVLNDEASVAGLHNHHNLCKEASKQNDNISILRKNIEHIRLLQSQGAFGVEQKAYRDIQTIREKIKEMEGSIRGIQRDTRALYETSGIGLAIVADAEKEEVDRTTARLVEKKFPDILGWIEKTAQAIVDREERIEKAEFSAKIEILANTSGLSRVGRTELDGLNMRKLRSGSIGLEGFLKQLREDYDKIGSGVQYRPNSHAMGARYSRPVQKDETDFGKAVNEVFRLPSVVEFMRLKAELKELELQTAAVKDSGGNIFDEKVRGMLDEIGDEFGDEVKKHANSLMRKKVLEMARGLEGKIQEKAVKLMERSFPGIYKIERFYPMGRKKPGRSVFAGVSEL